MAAGGLSGLLLTAPFVTRSGGGLAPSHCEQIAELIVVGRKRPGDRRLTAGAETGRRIDVLIDIDMGMGEPVSPIPGAVPGEESRRRGAAAPLSRVQAYYGHLQHIPTLSERRAKLEGAMGRLSGFTDALTANRSRRDRIRRRHRTHHPDLPTALHRDSAGFYIFMDKQYGAVELAPGGSPPFKTALYVAARVVSTVQPDRVIVDAGFKAMATDAGPAMLAVGPPPRPRISSWATSIA